MSYRRWDGQEAMQRYLRLLDDGHVVKSGISGRSKPICPRCGLAVGHSEHVLEFRLANAHASARKEDVYLKAAFHHGCAGEVWQAACKAWKGAA